MRGRGGEEEYVEEEEGKVSMETCTELRKATDFSVAMITCAAGMLGELRSSLWLPITIHGRISSDVRLREEEALDAPVSTTDLFDAVSKSLRGCKKT